MSWAWLLVLLVTYPWLLVADLFSDTLASWGMVIFITGAVLVVPCRRLKLWQSVLYAGCLGFIFEARRPIPDGTMAFWMMAAAIFLSTRRDWLRNFPLLMRAAVACNVLGCLVWYFASAWALPHHNAIAWGSVIPELALQLLTAGLAGLIFLLPVAYVQEAIMDRAGVPAAKDVV
jgi:hypothetical protein